MSQRQETATDRLVTIIQLIQLGRLTGKLLARRGEGLVSEEGFILFTRGQVTQAAAEQRHGSEAFNTLTTWGNCRFLFLPGEGTNEPTSDLRTTSPLSLPTSVRNSGYLEASERNRAMPISDHGHTNIEAAVPSPCHLPNVSLRVLTDRGLSRVHRQLLLLIDGQRSLAELMRLTGKSANEVDLLLRELAQADLIRLT